MREGRCFTTTQLSWKSSNRRCFCLRMFEVFSRMTEGERIKLLPPYLNRQGMQEETGATITIEEIDNIGRIEIAGTNKKCIEDAMRIIKGIVAVPEVGEVYKGKVRSIMPYGAFVEFLPGKDGLLHISEIDWKRLETVEEAGIKEGDEIDVKLLDIDPKTGKFKLSRKVLLPRPERQERPEKKEK